MSTCHACQTAETNPLTGLYHSDCLGCKERAIAQGIPFHRAQGAGKLTAEYRRVMALNFGDDWQTNGAHERIKAFKDKIRKASNDRSAGTN